MIYNIAGDFMDEGYVRDVGSSHRLAVEFVDGVLWDTDEVGHHITPLSLDSEGRLVGWGRGVSFDPDDKKAVSILLNVRQGA